MRRLLLALALCAPAPSRAQDFAAAASGTRTPESSLAQGFQALRPALADFRAPRTSVLVPGTGPRGSDPAVKGVLTLHFLLLRGSGWDQGLVAAHLERAASVFAQCGLRIDKAVLTETDAPGGRTRFLRWKNEGPGSLRELAAAAPGREKPMIYLFRGFEDDDDDAAFSRADFEEGGRDVDPALFGSVFLPWGVNSDAFREQRKDSPYSVAAHELWHVLTRIGGHFNVDPPNISNIWRTRADLILPRDCPRILANPLIRRP